MDTGELATWLLLAMPVTFAAKTATIGRSALMLVREESRHAYGRWAVRFFVALFATSLALTVSFVMLASENRDGIPGWWLWFLIPVEIASTATAVTGWRMVRAERLLP